MITPNEILRWRREGLESGFQVLVPGDTATDGDSTIVNGWPVMDAECEIVCVCETEQKAWIVAKALESYETAVELADAKLATEGRP